MIKLRAKILSFTCAQFNCKKHLLAACLSVILPLAANAQAIVVDNSENFAIIDEQQVAMQSPAAKKYDDRLIEQSADNDELPLAVDDGNKSIGNNDLKMIDQVHNLQKEIQELRGQLEVQSHEIKLLKQQQLTFYKELDGRIKGSPTQTQLNAASSALPLAAPAMIPVPKVNVTKPHVSMRSSNNPADEQISYLAAYELVKNKRFDEALSAMQTFLIQHPTGGYTANAHYWLGELYMVKNNYAKAIEQFNVVLKNFPTSSKSAASTLKMGYALAASGKKSEAIVRLQQVVNNYPDTAAAQLAAVKLDALHVT